MRKRWILLVLLLASCAGAVWWFRYPLEKWLRDVSGTVKSTVRRSPQPDPRRYEVILSELERWRRDLAKKHKSARTAVERAAVERDARLLLEQTLPEMMRCWLGTPWDFNGTASKPGGGRIACGYFVSTVLMDAGFHVDRYALARQPSGNILQSFVPREACTLTVGKPYDGFSDDIEHAEPGIYLVGLDTHVGFLVVRPSGFRFIHSSGSRPWCVVDEGRGEADVLRRSNWRMYGNLTATPEAVRLWLKGGRITVRGT